MYDYRVAAVRRVVDGDTVDLVLDVGFRLTTTQRFRLLEVDTPERHQSGWAECTAFTKQWLEARSGSLVARTEKTDVFGRWLADVHDDAGERLSAALRAFMIAGGFLKVSQYNGNEPTK